MRYIPQLPYEKEVTFYTYMNPNIFLLKLIPGIQPEFLSLIFEKYDAVIIESFGVGGIPQSIREAFYALCRKYPNKPIIISESGCGGTYGYRDENASINTEEYQNEYLTDIFETLWANPNVSGFSIWQMNDGRTRERYCELNCSAMFGGSVAGIYDIYRRPKKSVATVKHFFGLKAAGEN